MYKIYKDKDHGNWAEHNAINYGLRKGYTPMAVVGSRAMGAFAMVLFNLDRADMSYTKGVKLKAGEQLFRYATEQTVSGDFMPLIKVNLKRGLIYFLTQESSSGEIDEPVFETKGEKLFFARVTPATAPLVEGTKSLNDFIEQIKE